jgi:hypothetical protein
MKIINKALLTIVALLFSQIGFTSDIPKTVEVSGETLYLNGVGMRSKFFFDIYEGALYTASKVTNLDEILASGKNIRVAMHIRYGTLQTERLQAGWQKGFDNNMSAEELKTFANEITSFKKAFGTELKGNVINIDFTASGVNVGFNEKALGSINNAAFNEMVLRIWFGNNPADTDLMDGMLAK